MTEEIHVPDGTIRLDCKATGLEDAWMLLPDRGWTMVAIEYLKSHLQYDPKAAVEWVHKWVKAMSLPVLDTPETPEGGPKPAGPVTDPQALTVEILTHYMDGALIGFIISGISMGAQYTLTTSPFQIGVSLPGSDRTSKTETNKTPRKSRRRLK